MNDKLNVCIFEGERTCPNFMVDDSMCVQCLHNTIVHLLGVVVNLRKKLNEKGEM